MYRQIYIVHVLFNDFITYENCTCSYFKCVKICLYVRTTEGECQISETQSGEYKNCFMMRCSAVCTNFSKKPSTIFRIEDVGDFSTVTVEIAGSFENLITLLKTVSG